ncbi:M15 family metallopeptidase [Pyxidicoccus parkwayensis]|uniref:M15 family metallopeptidase n=2 Tax=Pyxidicoccus parkwayensis TaxID=2813578 RepID=A0ABX7PD03_9BACT|nr:M15 family metallopeptidase [Pyxidicoccus parkwaysis]
MGGGSPVRVQQHPDYVGRAVATAAHPLADAGAVADPVVLEGSGIVAGARSLADAGVVAGARTLADAGIVAGARSLADGDAASVEPPPARLTCLAKWYPAVVPVRAESGWSFRLPDGRTYPFDDGRVKSLAQKLESPDLEDTLSIPYRTGPLNPVTREDDDPGRIRFDPLFLATYGASEAKVDVVPVLILGQRLKVHRTAAPAFQRVGRRLEALLAKDASLKPFLVNLGGTFNWRTIANTRRRSAHSFGVSIDLNPAHAHFWEWQQPKTPLRWRNTVPQAVVEAFEAEGFIWGGRWYHYDTMHFEYRPELLDPACAPR